MSILCAGDTHVFQLNSLTCDCGAWGATAQPVNPYPLYYPHGPNNTTTTPPVAGEAPDVNIATFKAAQRAGASHLSADGSKAFVIRLGECCQANWIPTQGRYGSWWGMGGSILPPDAVAM